MILFIGLCVIAIATGVSIAIIQWKYEKGKPSRRKDGIGSFVAFVLLPLCLLDSLFEWTRKK